MKVCVYGLWHLGAVTAACLASKGHMIVGLDEDKPVIEKLSQGIPPLFEPGLEDLVKTGINKGSLRFSSDAKTSLSGCQVVWVTIDTPVDENDRADTESVINRIRNLFPHLENNTLVLLSSQMPVGSINLLEIYAKNYFGQKNIHFACSPENLRLGKAIGVFLNPDRIIIGARTEEDRQVIRELFESITGKLEFMSVESAEMTKHAINAFLALSVTYINEIASICEAVGADAREVERGLKTESRIGPRAYLSPGVAFSGGTLARDVEFLNQLSSRYNLDLSLFHAIRQSNEKHKGWAFRHIQQRIGDLQGKKIAVWGLTYKPGTDTLRRSASVELCENLSKRGAEIVVHDPAIKKLPDQLKQKISLAPDPYSTVKNAEVLVISTEWKDYKQVDPKLIDSNRGTLLVLDANGFLKDIFSNDPRFDYVTVGKMKK